MVGETATLKASSVRSAILLLMYVVPSPPGTPAEPLTRGTLAPICTRGATPTTAPIIGTTTSLSPLPCHRYAEIDTAIAAGSSTLASSIHANGTAPPVEGAAEDGGRAVRAGPAEVVGAAGLWAPDLPCALAGTATASASAALA